MKHGIFAGGCFWCTEAVFNRLKGVNNVKSGYTGGFIKNPPYREVCQGRTGHTEGISFDYDETLISYVDLLGVFFLYRKISRVIQRLPTQSKVWSSAKQGC